MWNTFGAWKQFFKKSFNFFVPASPAQRAGSRGLQERGEGQDDHQQLGWTEDIEEDPEPGNNLVETPWVWNWTLRLNQ